MKRSIFLFVALALLFSLFASFSYASVDIVLSDLTDEDLVSLYVRVKTEMAKRNLSFSEKMTLREGKFIVGEDILPGSYKITCTETAGETLGSAYASMGSFYSALDSDTAGLGAMMGSLGGMMGEVINTTVEIIGDYGTVLKSFELKSGDSTYITLTEKTALQITNGSCTLEAE